MQGQWVQLGSALASGWLTAWLSLGLLVVAVLIYLRPSRTAKLLDKLPGPKPYPLVGNALEILVPNYEILPTVEALVTLFGGSNKLVRAWLGPKPYVIIAKAQTSEPILSSSKHIDKSDDYRFIHPWLNTGLLTSTGEKWHTRRKLLTPAFHFKILEDFVDVFNEQSGILVRRLEHHSGGEVFNIFPYITLCALDIICETAMGQHVNAQSNTESEYVKAVYELGSLVQVRQARPWLFPEILFWLSGYATRQTKLLKVVHGFTNKVISERRNLLRRQEDEQGKDDDKEEEDVLRIGGKKKRLAFLDLLLRVKEFTDGDIREEVDTFMFEGHDTTAAAMNWCMFLLGHHQGVQDRVWSELEGIFGDSDRPATSNDLRQMKYLERCIKEALRLYPSVPIIGRELKSDVYIAPYTIPAGTTALILPYMMHKDPSVFPEPEKFNPENFSPENLDSRHPYAYVPFSAGPRNCIGQKFALMEEKIVVSTVLRHFRLESMDHRDEVPLVGELILRPHNGLRLKLTPRRPD